MSIGTDLHGRNCIIFQQSYSYQLVTISGSKMKCSVSIAIDAVKVGIYAQSGEKKKRLQSDDICKCINVM